jgi:hypothetical protein
MTSLKILFLVDDSTNAPFWKSDANWSDENWKDYKVVRINGENGNTVDYFFYEIDSIKNDCEYYIVTDAHFGSNAFGGSLLIERFLHDEKFKNGVIYSEEPNISANVVNSKKAIPLSRSKDSERCKQIYKYISGIETPEEYITNEQIKALSKVIHGVRNLFLPLTSDCLTLHSINDPIELQKMLESEIKNEYFGEDPIGYLMEGYFASSTHIENGGIEHELERLLRPCKGLFGESTNFPAHIPEWLNTYIKERYKFDYIQISACINVFDARAKYNKNNILTLLDKINYAGENIINSLRELRLEIQNTGYEK